MLMPHSVFFVAGAGQHREKLVSFEAALREAGIEAFNLVGVSSILPPKCKVVTPEEGLKQLHPGQIVHCVLPRMETNTEGRRIAASIGMARPIDMAHHGYLAEVHEYHLSEAEAAAKGEILAVAMLATTLGMEFELESKWEVPKGGYSLNGRELSTKGVAASALGQHGYWSTVIASAVFVI